MSRSEREAKEAVAGICRLLGGSFDEGLWESTRRGPFRSMAEVNGMRERHGQTPLDEAGYEAARRAYYTEHPSARGNPYDDLRLDPEEIVEDVMLP